MRKFLISVLSCAAAFVVATSCNNDDGILYTTLTFGEMSYGTKFLTDDGDIFHIVKNSTSNDLLMLSRIIGQFNVLNKTEGGAENEYDTELVAYAEPVIHDPVLTSESSDEILGKDPIELGQGWISGGYFNIRYGITIKKSSTTVHDINLEFDDKRSNDKTLYFVLRHNGHSETLSNTEIETSKLQYTGGYASFPIKSLIPEGTLEAGKNSIKIVMEWEWYTNEGIQLLRETESHSDNTTYNY